MVSSLTLSEMERGIGGTFDRDLGRNEMGMSRNNFGDSFERGMGQYFHYPVGQAPLTTVTVLTPLRCLVSASVLNCFVLVCLLLQEPPSTWIAWVLEWTAWAPTWIAWEEWNGWAWTGWIACLTWSGWAPDLTAWARGWTAWGRVWTGLVQAWTVWAPAWTASAPVALIAWARPDWTAWVPTWTSAPRWAWIAWAAPASTACPTTSTASAQPEAWTASPLAAWTAWAPTWIGWGPEASASLTAQPTWIADSVAIPLEEPAALEPGEAMPGRDVRSLSET